jgi:hypothetical protein
LGDPVTLIEKAFSCGTMFWQGNEKLLLGAG